MHDPAREEHKIDIEEATRYLHHDLAAKTAYHVDQTIYEYFLRYFNEKDTMKTVSNTVKHIDLSSILHSYGLNVNLIFYLFIFLCLILFLIFFKLRHLGRVRNYLEISNLNSRSFILENAVARVIKNLMNKKMRELMNVLEYPCEEPFKQIVAEFLNLLTVLHLKKEKTIRFWAHKVTKNLSRNFPLIMSDPSPKDIGFIF